MLVSPVLIQIPNHMAISIRGQISPWLEYDKCSHELQIDMPTWTAEYSGPSLFDVHRQLWKECCKSVLLNCSAIPSDCGWSAVVLILLIFNSLCIFENRFNSKFLPWFVCSFNKTPELWLFLEHLWLVLDVLYTICWNNRPPQGYGNCPF